MVSNDTIILAVNYLASSAEIQKALADMRTAIDSGKFQPINRTKNKDTLAALGLTWKDAKEEIYSLSERHYRRGPMEDRDDPETDFFWEFKKNVDGNVIYIKFKVMYQEDGRVKVVSFHLDE